MSWKGRIIGTVLGLLILGPVGAIIGFCIGFFAYDKPRNIVATQNMRARDTFMGTNGNTQAHTQILESTFCFMGYVARGAGRVNESHIHVAEQLMDTMRLDEARRRFAINAFTFGKSDDINLDVELAKLRPFISNNASLISYFLEIQVALAIADGILEQGEHERLLRIAMGLGINAESMERLIRIRIAEQQFARFSQQYAYQRQKYYEQQHGAGSYSNYDNKSYEDYEKFGPDENDKNTYSSTAASKSELDHAYEILGVTPETPWEDIRRAHKKLMLKYHPDRLASQGLPPEMINLYTEKAQDIQAAFALIKSAHNK